MPSVIVCPACDLAHRRDAAPPTGRMRCSRCRGMLQLPRKASLDTAIALAVCALVFLLLSNVYPLVAVHAEGATRETTLTGAAFGFYAQGYRSLAALVFLTTVLAPFAQIATLLYVLIPLRRNRHARAQNVLFRLLTQIRPWTFVEVFMLGALVALVRLAAFAHVVPGIALWSSGFLMLSLSALTHLTSPEQFWSWVEGSRE
jgi:paraquat-inducible protein A